MTQPEPKSMGPRIVAMLIALVLCAVFFFFVFLRRQVNSEFTPSPSPLAAQDSSGYCDEFVAFTFACGLARPEIDPSKDEPAQRARNRQVQERLAGNCREKRAPYDERLIQCYLKAGGYCDAYHACTESLTRQR